MKKIMLALAAVAALGLGAFVGEAQADHGRGWGGGYGGYYGRSYGPWYYDGCYGGYGYGGYHHHHRHYHRGYPGGGIYLRSPGFGIYLGF
jgi:hypothetical protein